MVSILNSSRNSIRLKNRCPLWVISGHCPLSARCPHYPRKRTSRKTVVMSALCQEQTSRPASAYVGAGKKGLERAHGVSHSGLSPALSTTLVTRSISSAMACANASGPSPAGSMPSVANCGVTSGCWTIMMASVAIF
jgi:hypothetical protein